MPSPVTPTQFCETIPESTGSICSKLNALWSLANKVCDFFSWFLDVDGNLSEEGIGLLAPASVPVGSVVFWLMDSPPEGWLTLNGATVSRTTYSNLFALWGTRYGAGDGLTTFGLPDSRRRFPFGASGTNLAGSTGGAESVVLTTPNLPSHRPAAADNVERLFVNTVDATGPNGLVATPGGWKPFDFADVFDTVGEDEPVEILNPYLSAHWIVKI